MKKSAIRKAKEIYKKEGRSEMLYFLKNKLGTHEGLRVAKDILAGNL